MQQQSQPTDHWCHAQWLKKPCAKHDLQSFVVLDMGLPRNVENSVNELPNVFLYDVGALNRVVDINLSKRRSEIPRVEGLIEEEAFTASRMEIVRCGWPDDCGNAWAR